MISLSVPSIQKRRGRECSFCRMKMSGKLVWLSQVMILGTWYNLNWRPIGVSLFVLKLHTAQSEVSHSGFMNGNAVLGWVLCYFPKTSPSFYACPSNRVWLTFVLHQWNVLIWIYFEPSRISSLLTQVQYMILHCFRRRDQQLNSQSTKKTIFLLLNVCLLYSQGSVAIQYLMCIFSSPVRPLTMNRRSCWQPKVGFPYPVCLCTDHTRLVIITFSNIQFYLRQKNWPKMYVWALSRPVKMLVSKILIRLRH